jgi:hypothetical protein
MKGGTDRQVDDYEEDNSRFTNCANASMKFVYARLRAMVPADCNICTCVVGDNGKK